METSLRIRTESMVFELSMMRDLLRLEREILIEKRKEKNCAQRRRRRNVNLSEQIGREFFDNYLHGNVRKDYPKILEDL